MKCCIGSLGFSGCYILRLGFCNVLAFPLDCSGVLHRWMLREAGALAKAIVSCG